MAAAHFRPGQREACGYFLGVAEDAVFCFFCWPAAVALVAFCEDFF